MVATAKASEAPPGTDGMEEARPAATWLDGGWADAGCTGAGWGGYDLARGGVNQQGMGETGQ